MDESTYQGIYRFLLEHFADDHVDELLVNGATRLWLVAGGKTRAASSPFAEVALQISWLAQLARRSQIRLDPLCGSAGGSLEGHGYRWHCLLPPLTQDGPLLSIRRHRFATLRLASFGGDPAAKRALQTAFCGAANLVFAGATGSGKTTLLAALLGEYAADDRTIIVESLAELPAPSACSVRLLERQANLEGVGAVSMARLVHEALRLRPDRLVIGEIRSHEAAAFLEAVLSGHRGVMTTLHANSPEDVLARLSLLSRGAGWRPPSAGWQGIPLVVVMLGRGVPPSITAVKPLHFVPSG